MDFKLFFSTLKKRIADGYTVPEFFRDLMAMITEVTEDDWGTKKDPSTNLTNDETIRTYSKRKTLTKDLANRILYRLTPENFKERIEERPEATRNLLADDFRAFFPDADADNIGGLLADELVSIIRKSAGLVDQDALTQDRQRQLAATLKTTMGAYLLNEANRMCPFPGCGHRLVIANNGNVIESYEVSLIEKDKNAEISNALALCPRCHSIYQLDNNKKVTKSLKETKIILAAHKQCVDMLDDMPLEKGIIDVISRIKKLKGSDLDPPSLEAKEIREKLDPDDDYVLYSTVCNLAVPYYGRICDIMANLDKRGIIDYEDVQNQMKAIYKKLKKSKKTNAQIFNEIVKKVHSVSLREDIYCQIVVAHFVQSCEVFDAITQ